MSPIIPRKKVELHLHLDGAIRPSTAWELAQKKCMTFPCISNFVGFEKACQVSIPSNLMGFIHKFDLFWPPFCGDMDALERMGYEFCEDASYAGIIYAEVRYCAETALGEEALKRLGPSALDETIRRISNGLRRGEEDFGVMTRTILCSVYNTKFNTLRDTLRLCQNHYQDGVVGMDLLTLQPDQGFIDEAPVVEPIVSVFQEAARTGVHRTVHAAEASGAEAVNRAFYQLKSERIGHGYHVVENPGLYQRCIDDQVHFECCPYSSLMTGSVKTDGPSHPIVRFAKDGANFSINSDDPTVTGHFVQDDYELVSTWGLTAQQMTQANINAVESCFLDEQSKKELMKKLKC